MRPGRGSDRTRTRQAGSRPKAVVVVATTLRAQQILSHTPMDRFGAPEELVGAAVFLASDSASGFVTGTDVRVDGGFLSTTI